MNTEMNTATKTCNTCRETRPISSFSKDRAKADGLQYQCKLCAKERNRRYREQNRDELLEYQRQYREQNRDELLEYQRQYREQNSDAVQEAKRRYNEQNSDAVRERNRQYREQNKDEVREYQRRYYEQNKAEISDYNRRYNAANPQAHATKDALRRSPLTESELFCGLSRSQVNAEVRFDYILRDLLTQKTGVQHHVDHIKPICEGGVHRMWNLAVVTEERNLAKGPVWYCEDHLTDDDIEAQDEATLAFVPAE